MQRRQVESNMDLKYNIQRQSSLDQKSSFSKQTSQHPQMNQDDHSKFKQPSEEYNERIDTYQYQHENSPVNHLRKPLYLPKQSAALSSQELSGTYHNFQQSTKSCSRASGSSLLRSHPNNLGDINSLGFSQKIDYFEQTSPLDSQQENISPHIQSSFSNSTLQERQLYSNRSSSNLNGIDAAYAGELKVQFAKKLGQLEIDLKKETIKTQSLDIENKNLKKQLKVAALEVKELHRAIDKITKAPDITVKILAEEAGTDERKLKQFTEKAEIESKLTKECDRLIEIIDNKEGQISQWIERFNSLKENNQQIQLQRYSELEKQSDLLRQQLETSRSDAKKICELNASLQRQLEDIYRENDSLKMNYQMQQEEARQNQEMLKEQSQQNQRVFKDQVKQKEELEMLIRSLQSTKEDLEQALLNQSNLLQESRAQAQNLDNQLVNQKSVFEERITEYEAVLNDIRAQLNQKNLEVNLDKKEFENIKNSIFNKNQELSQKLEDKQIQIQDYLKLIEKQGDDQQEQSRKIVELQKKYNEKVSQLEESEQEQMGLRNRISELEEELRVIRLESIRFLAEIEQLQTKYQQVITEKDSIQAAERDLRKETKKSIVDSERKTFLVENQNKILEKQLLIYKEKLADCDHQVTNLLKEKNDSVAAHQQQLCNLRAQINSVKTANDEEREDQEQRHQQEISKKQTQIDDLSSQLRQLNEKQSFDQKVKEKLTKDISNLQNQLEIQIMTSKDAERRLHERIQEAVSKISRELREKEEEINFFEKENENLNRIVTQQKMEIFMLHNKDEGQTISSLSEEEELLQQIGLGKLISACRAKTEIPLNKNISTGTQEANTLKCYQDNSNNNISKDIEDVNSNKFSFSCSTKNSSQNQEENHQKDMEQREMFEIIRAQQLKSQQELKEHNSQWICSQQEQQQRKGIYQEDQVINKNSTRESISFSVDSNRIVGQNSEFNIYS